MGVASEENKETAGDAERRRGLRVTRRDRELLAMAAMARYLSSEQIRRLFFSGRTEAAFRIRLFHLAGLGKNPQPTPYIRRLRFRSFEGKWFSAWTPTPLGRSQHLLRHLGNAKVQALSVADVDRYRALRLAERSIRGTPPASSTLDYEVELLKRILNYSAECDVIPSNPIARAKLLRKPNVRTSVITEEVFRRLSDACEPALKPILTVAFDTGMRKREILDLRWEQVDLKLGIIRLAPQDTKGRSIARFT